MFFSNLRSAVAGAMASLDGVNGGSSGTGAIPKNILQPKFPYGRPHFLTLDEEEVQISADHRLRPVIHPSKTLPYNAGYAECVNAGKSKWNEDQAVYRQSSLSKIATIDVLGPKKYIIPYTYYGIFDGHAGVGAALCAANQLHHILHEKLVDAQDDIWLEFSGLEQTRVKNRDLLIVGALEASFREMDQLIAEDRTKYQAAGGCTVLVSLIILGRLYVANAGDSRAIICNDRSYRPMSVDFTPENERTRIRQLAEEQPALLGKEYTFRDYLQRPTQSDLGKPILYRDAYMKGWAYKTLQVDDLKVPVVTGHGKRSRVMGTIGVARGFGDHDLLSVYQRIPIKPLLSSRPDVQIVHLDKAVKDEVLVMGTDGLWDVISSRKAAEIISKVLNTFKEKDRYVSAATCLVGAARGSLVHGHAWRLKSGQQASVDDISVFVIPLFYYKEEHKDWKAQYLANPMDVDEN